MANNQFESDLIVYRAEQTIKWKKTRQLETNAKNIVPPNQPNQPNQPKIEATQTESMYELEMFFKYLDQSIVKVSNAKSIIIIDSIMSDFHYKLEEKIMLVIELGQTSLVIEKVYQLGYAISQNPHASFNILDYNSFAVKSKNKIIEHLKSILLILDCDPMVLDICTMDTTNDKEFAEKLNKELNM
jgi:hypothetical protein